MFKIGYIPCERTFADNFPPSETIQDDSLTIREILTRFAGGQPLPQISSEGTFSDIEPDIDDDTYNIDMDDPYEVSSAIERIKNRQQDFENQKYELQQRLLALQSEPEPKPEPKPEV